MTIYTLPQGATKARHRVDKHVDPCWWVYNYYEPAGEGEVALHVCEVELSEHPGQPGRFGCCCHGIGFRSADFPESVAVSLVTENRDSIPFTLGRFKAIAFGGPAGTSYFWKITGRRKVWSGWRSRPGMIDVIRGFILEEQRK